MKNKEAGIILINDESLLTAINELEAQIDDISDMLDSRRLVISHIETILEDWFDHSDTWCAPDKIESILEDLNDLDEYYGSEYTLMRAVIKLMYHHPRLKPILSKIQTVSIHTIDGDMIVHYFN